MGILSGKFKFRIGDEKWRVDMRFRMKGYRFTVRINDEIVHDEHTVQDGVQMISLTVISFTRQSRDYDLHIAPAGHWSYGLHVYQGGILQHRYKNRALKTLTKLEKTIAWIEKNTPQPAHTDRAYWKELVEIAIICFVFGLVAFAGVDHAQNAGWINPDFDPKYWLIACGASFGLFRPIGLRFIK